MASIYETAIQQLYVTYLARPADPDGLKYWESVVEGAHGDTSAVAAAFAQSAEYKQITGKMNVYAVVDNLYQGLFGHGADIGGLDYWSQALLKGGLTIDQAATAIAGGAQGSDLQEFHLKVAAASDFTAALDTPAKVQAYEGSGGMYWGEYYLSQVTPANPHPSFDQPVFSTGPIPAGPVSSAPVFTGPVPAGVDGHVVVELVGIHHL